MILAWNSYKQSITCNFAKQVVVVTWHLAKQLGFSYWAFSQVEGGGYCKYYFT